MAGATAAKVTFAIPFLQNYGRMAQALAHAIRQFHPGCDIVALTTVPGTAAVRSVARQSFDDLIELPDPGFDAAGYTPVVWTRLHLWDIPTGDPVICLDADMQLYRPVPGVVVSEWKASGAVFGAFLDGMSRLGQQFAPGYAPVAKFADAPAPCAAYLIMQPRPGVTERLLDLARRHDGQVICPEQAILGLYAAMHGGWLDQSASTVTQSWSPAVLRDPPPTPLVHFGSPRPSFFGPSPLREGDIAYDVALKRFKEKTGQDYPVERFRAEFEMRLRGRPLGEGAG